MKRVTHTPVRLTFDMNAKVIHVAVIYVCVIYSTSPHIANYPQQPCHRKQWKNVNDTSSHTSCHVPRVASLTPTSPNAVCWKPEEYFTRLPGCWWRHNATIHTMPLSTIDTLYTADVTRRWRQSHRYDRSTWHCTSKTKSALSTYCTLKRKFESML